MTSPDRFLVVVEGKAGAPFGGSAKPFGTKPQGGADAMPAIPEEEPLDEEFPEEEEVVEEEVATHEWAGDLVDEGVEEVSDPAMAFSTFTGTEGETAWLDRGDDGTLTAWVRDSDGSVYRYQDVDAWAIDVDDAQMVRSDGAEQPADEEVDEEAMAEEDGSAGGDTTGEPEDFLTEGKAVVLRASVVRPKV